MHVEQVRRAVRNVPTHTLTPCELRPREPDEEEALAFASGREPAHERASEWSALLAALALAVFLLAAMLR